MHEPRTAWHGGGRCRFGVFEFDLRALELHKSGRLVAIRPQPLKVLARLLARPGELVTREDLERELWGDDTFVDFEQGVNHAIRDLRAALGDAAESPRFIQTLPRRGYRFIAPVTLTAVDEVATARAPSGELPRPLVNGEPAFEPPGGPQMSSVSRWPLAVAVVLAVGLAGGTVWWRLPRAGPSRTAAESLLVVRPFSASEADRLLGTGLATAIAARLGGQQALSVRLLPVGGNPSLVLDGEIARSGSEVTVFARLERVADGNAVWSERIRLRADALFSAEAVIAERVLGALRLRLAADEQARLRRRYTDNSAAYEDYLRGRAALVRYTPEATQQAVDAFEAALQRDPGYALARAGLAMASADMYLRFAPPAEVERWGERAEAEAGTALNLDGDLAEAHLARAAVARKREFDWNLTMEASRRALVLNPNLDQPRLFMAAAYYHLGYMEEAIIEMEKARRLRGGDVIEPVRIGALVSLFSGQFNPARVHLEEVSRLSSQAIGDTYLALAYHYSGSGERAVPMLESLAAHSSASTSARAGAALAGVLAARGDAAAARLRLDGVLRRQYRDHHVAYSLGAAYAQLGDVEASGRWLRIAADTGFPCVPWFERDPLLESLRARPEFAALMAYVRARRESSLSTVNP
jgi:DNA-binding winged helix-turn-helix (wHTH) protein/tetratricopeptide (TPR) repeat protein